MYQNDNILVADTATQQHAYLVSKTRPFRINEMLVIEDDSLFNPKCEVKETSTVNRNFNIANNDLKILDDNVLNNLKKLDIDINEDTIHIAKVQFLNELIYPIPVGSKGRLLTKDEVEDVYINGALDRTLQLGVYNATEENFDMLSEKYQDLFPLFDNNKKGIVSQNRIPFLYNFREMDNYPHILITGGSGGGKSVCIRALSEELMMKGIPGVLLDPHLEFDFSESFKGLPSKYQKSLSDRYVVLEAGKDVCINFQELSSGELVQLISANTKEFSEHMQNAIYATYEKNFTFDSYLKKLKDIVIALEMSGKELEEHSSRDYYEKLRDRYGSFGSKTIEAVIRRITGLAMQNLFGSAGITEIYNNILQGKLVVIQGKIKYLRMFSGYMLSNLYHKRRNYRDYLKDPDVQAEPFPGFMVIFDEAHNFAPNSGDDIIPSKFIIREIAQEGRKYGIQLVPATQRPSLLDSTTQAMINTKFIFRTTRESDIETIRKETDLTKEDIRRLPYLQSGKCFISSPIIGRTIFAQIRCTYTQSPHSENSFDETFAMIQKENNEFLDQVKKYFPIGETDFPKIIRNLNNTTDKEYDTKKLTLELESLIRKGQVYKDDDNFLLGTTYYLR